MTLNRWVILAVLFIARLTMAFQFQSIGALSPVIIDNYALDLASIGLLVGLYLAPGVVVAIPGGAIASRFGDKRIVGLGMVLMLIGSIIPILFPDWNSLVSGRLIAGTGGVVLNVVMTKMLVDWFSGKEISTALGIFVNSWPAGIALALLVLPIISVSGNLDLAWWVTTAFILTGYLMFMVVYRQAPEAAAVSIDISPSKLPIYPLVLASSIWALYNAALAMIFSFGPVLLNEAGWSVAEAGTAISAFMIIFSLALPVGGIIADRTGRRDLMILISLVSFAILMPFVPASSPVPLVIILIAVGGLFALAAGPIMTLPSLVLPPHIRTLGMGVFFSVYYGVMMIAPRIVGGIADHASNSGVAVYAGVAMCLASIVALELFRRAVRPSAAAG